MEMTSECRICPKHFRMFGNGAQGYTSAALSIRKFTVKRKEACASLSVCIGLYSIFLSAASFCVMAACAFFTHTALAAHSEHIRAIIWCSSSFSIIVPAAFLLSSDMGINRLTYGVTPGRR